MLITRTEKNRYNIKIWGIMFSLNCFVLGRKDDYEGKNLKKKLIAVVFLYKRENCWNLKLKKNFY